MCAEKLNSNQGPLPGIDGICEAELQMERPLCVDLDGTLISTDLLAESALVLIKLNPFYVLLMVLWLLRGRAFLKMQIASRISLNVEVLPYHERLRDFLEAAKCSGRQIVLATAATDSLARKVALHLGYFSEVLASDAVLNLSGKMKKEVLEKRFGPRGFDYIGNSEEDRFVWQTAHAAILVSPGKRLAAKVRHDPKIRVDAIFCQAPRSWMGLTKALRIHQWAKNLLVFTPVIAAHRISDRTSLVHSLVAFLAFCLCASGLYVLNDLFDLESDRQHLTKKNRPFASGQLSIWLAIAGVPLLLASGLGIAGVLLPFSFLRILLLYCCLTLGYSFRFKKIPVLDIMLLCIFYTLRIMAGGAAANIIISPWFLGFSIFLFLSLALVKRVSELRSVRSSHQTIANGRGYQAGDVEQLTSLGSSSGYLAALVLALYLSSPDVRLLYARPERLWLLCLLLLYWISRVWLLTNRGLVNEDPIVFALKDKITYIVCSAAAVVLFFSF